MKIANILVSMDFGDASMEALAWALRSAEQLEAKVNLVHVVRGDDVREKADAMEALHELAKLYASPALGNYNVLVGEPSHAVVQFALETNTDLLVIGMNGGLGLHSALIGGVAEGILRSARCPVVVARPSELGLLRNAEAQRNDRPLHGLALEEKQLGTDDD
jgi:nucleotide-binding universal stress UspA family protein